MAESLGDDKGVRVDEDGHGPDQGEDDQEGGGEHGDRPLHQIAVGGGRRVNGDGSEESENEGYESSDPVITLIKIPFQLPENREGKAEGNQSN